MAAILPTDNLTILSWPRSRIAWQPLRVVKPGPCRLTPFALPIHNVRSSVGQLLIGPAFGSAMPPTSVSCWHPLESEFWRGVLRASLPTLPSSAVPA